MTDTTTTAPRPGWYTDPSGERAYRWWDGQRWTAQTLEGAPGTGAPGDGAPGEAAPRDSASREGAPAEGAPRDSAPREDAPHASAPLESAPRATAPLEPGPGHPSLSSAGALPSRRSLRQSAGVHSELSAPVPTPQPAAYVPVNPLGAAAAPVPSPASPAAQTAAGWHTPDAWIANAPAAAPETSAQPGRGHPGQGHAVYGTGSPFGPRQPRMPMVKAINRPARNGFALGILSSIFLICLVAATLISGTVYLVWSFWAVIGMISSIVGLVRANRWEATGLVPLGRRRAVAGIILCGVALLGQGTESALYFATDIGRSSAATTPLTAPPAAPGVTGSGTGTGGGAGAGAASGTSPSASQAPRFGHPQSDGTLAYSQTEAQTTIATAYSAQLKQLPLSVVCPASATLAVASGFSCRVTMPGGAVTTAHVTIVDAEGHAEISVS